MAKKRKICCECSRPLTKEEVALTQKLIDLDTDTFYCLDCLAAYIGCTVEDLQSKISEFQEQGCTLFL